MIKVYYKLNWIELKSPEYLALIQNVSVISQNFYTFLKFSSFIYVHRARYSLISKHFMLLLLPLILRITVSCTHLGVTVRPSRPGTNSVTKSSPSPTPALG